MNLTAGLPGWILRAALLGTIALIVILLLAQGLGTFPAVVIAILGVLSVFAPASPAPAFVIIATAASAVVVGPDALSLGVLALLPLVHLVHIGSALAAVIPGTARVHLAALRPAAIRFAVVQLAVLAFAAAATLVPKSVTPAALEVAALLGTAAIAAIVTVSILKRPQ